MTITLVGISSYSAPSLDRKKTVDTKGTWYIESTS